MLLRSWLWMTVLACIAAGPSWSDDIEPEKRENAPILQVTDPVGATDDLSVDFGTLAPGESKELSITISNAGAADLTIGSFALAAGAFSIAGDGCSGVRLSPDEICTVALSFQPADAGSFSGSLDVVPQGAAGAAVRVDLHGTAEVSLAADAEGPVIVVTTADSVVDDLVLDFGAVFLDRTRDLNVTVSNGGNADLVLGPLGLAGVLLPPFSEVSDGCSARTLAPAGRCSIRLRFSPTVFGNFQGGFDVASNDPNRPSVAVSLRGMAGPDIRVTDAVLPEDDGLLPFGNVPLGMAKRKTVHVSNPGTGDLQLGVIAAPTDSRFTIVGAEENSRHCSERLLGPRQSCFVIVSFRPTEETDFSGTLTILSNDPETPAVAVSLAGTGGAPTADFPAPALIHPDPGQTNLREDVTFRWSNCRDAGGRNATYRFYCSKNTDFSESRIRSVGATTLQLAAFGLGGAFLLAPGKRRRFRGAGLLLLGLCVAAFLLACSEDIEDSSTATLSELEPNTAYNWKVVAEYDDGLENESEVRTFTTRP